MRGVAIVTVTIAIRPVVASLVAIGRAGLLSCWLCPQHTPCISPQCIDADQRMDEFEPRGLPLFCFFADLPSPRSFFPGRSITVS